MKNKGGISLKSYPWQSEHKIFLDDEEININKKKIYMQFLKYWNVKFNEIFFNIFFPVKAIYMCKKADLSPMSFLTDR